MEAAYVSINRQCVAHMSSGVLRIWEDNFSHDICSETKELEITLKQNKIYAKG